MHSLEFYVNSYEHTDLLALYHFTWCTHMPQTSSLQHMRNYRHRNPLAIRWNILEFRSQNPISWQEIQELLPLRKPSRHHSHSNRKAPTHTLPQTSSCILAFLNFSIHLPPLPQLAPLILPFIPLPPISFFVCWLSKDDGSFFLEVSIH